MPAHGSSSPTVAKPSIADGLGQSSQNSTVQADCYLPEPAAIIRHPVYYLDIVVLKAGICPPLTVQINAESPTGRRYPF